MKLESALKETDEEFLISVYPYDDEQYIVIYQKFNSDCARIVLENTEYETRETIFLESSQELH